MDYGSLDKPLEGTLEVDETYVGGKHKREGMLDNKMAVIGVVERKKVRAVLRLW